MVKHSEQKNQQDNNVDSRKYIPKTYKKLAKDMEQQFAKYMVEQMTKTVGKKESISPASNYYQDLLTDEYTKSLSKSNDDLGIQELILDDVYPKKFRNEANYSAYLEMQKRKNITNKNDISMVGPAQPIKKQA